MSGPTTVVMSAEAPSALLMGGVWRSPLSRVQWQAVVRPTLAADSARRRPAQRLNIALAVPVTPPVPTRAGAMEALADWGRANGYGRLEVLELSAPMTDADRAMLNALKHAVWPTPPPSYTPALGPPPGRPQLNPLVRP